MKRLLFGITMLLLFTSIAYSHDFNFTTPTEIYSGTLYRGLPKGYYDGVTGNWFVYLPIADGSEAVLTVKKYDTDWTVLDTDSEDCTNAGDNCYDTDCNYVIGEERYFECLGRENDGTPEFILYKYFFDNTSFVTIDTRSSYLTYPLTLAVSNRYEDVSGVASPLVLWNSFIRQDDLYYSLENDIGTGTKIDIPATYHQPDNVQTVYCNDAYYVFIEYSDSLFALVYDLDLTYQTVYSLSPSGWYLQDNYYGVESIDDNIYLVQVNDTLADNDGGLINIQSLYCDSDYTLTEVFQQTYNQTDIEATANITANDKITNPYLTKDQNDVFNLFYQFDGGIKNAEDFASCVCGSWLNTTICTDDKIKQTRSCFPTGCDDVIRFVDSTYCEKQLNISQGIFNQEYRVYSDSSICDTDWVETLENPITRCDSQIEIPQNCVNPNITNKLNLLTEYVDIILQGNTNNFTSKVCSPLADCDVDTNYLCQDVATGNVTWTKEVTTYVGGDSVSSGFVIDGTDCATWKAWFVSIGAKEGWYKHRVIGTTNLNCELACGGTKCLTEGLVEYSATEFIDCTVNTTSKTECDYGCDTNTGLCKTATGGAEGDEDDWLEKGKFDNPIYWLNILIKPSATMKFIYSLFVSSILGVVGISITKDKHPMMFLAGFAVGFIFFVLIGWIPAIVLIIMVFMVLVWLGMKGLK